MKIELTEWDVHRLYLLLKKSVDVIQHPNNDKYTFRKEDSDLLDKLAIAIASGE